MIVPKPVSGSQTGVHRVAFIITALLTEGTNVKPALGGCNRPDQNTLDQISNTLDCVNQKGILTSYY